MLNKIFKINIFILLSTIFLYSCDSSSSGTPCIEDADCKGERICSDGICVFPQDQPADGDPDIDAVDGDIAETEIDDTELETEEETQPCSPDPCKDEENKICEEATGTCICKPGFCQIGQNCVADNTSHPLHPCLVCDSSRNNSDWSTQDSSHQCRASAGICDAAEFCNGSDIDCPQDIKLTSECRAPEGECDAAEICDGINNECPFDLKLTTKCRESMGICDAEDFCDGVNNICPEDLKLTSICRESAGVCDKADYCDGINNTCPTDLKLTDECRPSKGNCDIAEFCDGINNYCPIDKKSSNLCRAKAGECDIAEFCNGTDDHCPADQKLTTVCRGSAGECDAIEFCDGQNNDCPEDQKLISICRFSEGQCDIAEYCTGQSNDCPSDQKSTATCREADDACDLAESCDGISNSCPDDLKAEPGTSCADDNLCNGAEICDGFGSCQTGTSIVCDDMINCTTDLCDPASGSCYIEIDDNYCVIDDTCVLDREENPANICEWCFASFNNTDWHPKNSGTGCETDSDPCTADVCNGEGVCTHPYNTASCNDDNDCTDNDICDNGTCLGTTYSCNDQGTCNSYNDACSCTTGYAGDYCDECAYGYINYPNCIKQYVTIPSGTFEMGCMPNDTRCFDNEKPQHTVTVSSFQMMTTEVTNEQYARFMNYNGDVKCGPYYCITLYSSERQITKIDDVWYAKTGYENRPMMSVTSHGAKAYCNWVGARLPNEAEFEYAARGGTTTIFYCGDDVECLDDIAWHKNNSYNHSHPIATKEPNAFGLYDILGNVSEWTSERWHDNYDDYPTSGTDWEGGSDYYFAIRGGNWEALYYLRPSFRYDVHHAEYGDLLGFRCVR